MVLQLLDGVASRCQHKNWGDGKVNISETCFAFSSSNIHLIFLVLQKYNSDVLCSARVMDLESVMCELAGGGTTSNTSIVPLLSLETEQFMCQVSTKKKLISYIHASVQLYDTRCNVHLVVRQVPPRLKTQRFLCRIAPIFLVLLYGLSYCTSHCTPHSKLKRKTNHLPLQYSANIIRYYF